MQIASFAADNLTDKDREILQLRMQGHTEKEIAEKVGYQTASAVHKRIAHIANAYEDFVMSEYQNYSSVRFLHGAWRGTALLKLPTS